MYLDLEDLLSKKRMPTRHFILFALFLFFSVIIGIFEENYLSVIIILISGFICFSFSLEIKKLNEYTNLLTYQKNIAANGFDASLFAFFIFSKAGKCVFMNRVAQNLFQGFKIRTIEDFLFCFGKFPKVVDAIRNLQMAADNEKPSHLDIPMKLQNDKVALWRIAVSPIPEYNGFFGWTIIDLTPSISRIDSPETNSNFLLDILNSSTVGYFCLNEDKEIIFCNEFFANWLNSRPEDIESNSFFKYILKEKSENLPSDDGKLLNSLPAKITLKSGTNDGIGIVVRQIMRDNEKTCYLATRDVQYGTDVVQALSKTKLYFEHIFEDAPIGIVVTNGAELVSASNQTFRRISGMDETEGPSLLDHVQDEEKEQVREKLYQFLSAINDSIPPFEIHFKIRKEKTVMVYVTKIDEVKRSKENDGLVMYFVDITERKELQQQFIQSQKMQAVGQLAGGIANDFNNLLTAMIGYCDLLLEKYLPSDQSFNDIVQIKQNANRASNLVRQLLAFSRQQTLQPKVSCVTDMISELSALLKRLIGANVELKVIHGKDIGFIKVDQVQFEQVIINLAVNARDAMKSGGVLTIRTSLYASKEPKFLREDTMPAGNYVLIEVIDTGSGIEEKYMSRIFDPFFSSKEKGHGTGLGLSTVYGIINQTGGFISVESEVGVGTKFSLYFPMISVQEQVIDSSKEKEEKIVDLTGNGTILLVEDEDAVRMFSSRALRDKGYRVIESSNGESALEFIKKEGNNINLVISDVVMPKMDGPTLINHVMEHNPLMKIIFISGYAEDSFRDSLSKDKRIHFLPKPFNLKELASKVKEVMQ